VAARLEQDAAVGTNPLQGMLFPDMQLSAAPAIRGRGRGRGKRAGFEVSDESLAASREATTLDRVHAAMLLQAGGRTNALRALLKAEQERGPDFLRLANAFSALYPKGSEEKRLIDAMLLAVPR
jgi:putative DNA methylase